MPENIRQLVARQGERLSRAAQRILEAGSVAGMEFSAAAVAAALAWDVADIEEQCAALAGRQQFLRPAGIAEWPDGTRAARYGFLHALYQQLWHERVSVSQLQRWHLRIGERKEAAYGKRKDEIATELAVHFEQGRDYRRAVQYLHLAGENATRRSAHREAISLLTKGLELLKTLPDTPECPRQELALQIALGVSLSVTRGYAAPEVEKTYTRALELCRNVGETPQLFRVLRGLWYFHLARAEYQRARELAEQCLTLAQRVQDLPLLLESRLALGQTLYYLGEFALARPHLEQGIVLYNPLQHSSHTFRFSVMFCLQFVAFALWHLGYPEQALKRIHEALTLAQELADPFNSAFTIASTAQLHQYRGERRTAQEWAEAAMTLATEQEFALPLTIGTMIQGWALDEQEEGEEGVAQIRQGLAAWQATGAETLRPYFLTLLAEAYGRGGKSGAGLGVLTEALAAVDKSGERWYEAELYRLYGELTLQQENQKAKIKRQKAKIETDRSLTPDPQAEAEACFQKAIDIACKQHAKSLELRAAMSLFRLRQCQMVESASRNTQHVTRNRLAEAHQMLSEVYGWFTEGFDTKDLQEAKTLLDELM